MKLLWAMLGVCVTSLSLATESLDDPKYQYKIHLGLPADEIHANATPDSRQKLPGDAAIEEYPLHNGTADLLILDGKVVQVDYHKGGIQDLPFTQEEIQKVLDVNTLGSKWTKINEHAWVLENNKAYLLYGHFTDKSQHVIVVITPKAVAYWELLDEHEAKSGKPAPKSDSHPKKQPKELSNTTIKV